MSKEFFVCQTFIVAIARREYYDVKAENKEEAVHLVENKKCKPIRIEADEKSFFHLDPEATGGMPTHLIHIDGEIVKDNLKSFEECKAYYYDKFGEYLVGEFLEHIQKYLPNDGSKTKIRLSKPVFITDGQGSDLVNAAVYAIEIDPDSDIKFLAKIANGEEDATTYLEDINPSYLPYICKCIGNED